MTIAFGKIIVLTAGGVIGGVTGYLLADLLIFKLQEEQTFPEDEWKPTEEFVEGEETEQRGIVVKKPKDYTSYSKGKLEELAAPYQKSKRDPWVIISLENWTVKRHSSNSETITYYEDDMTFANENEEIIHNPIDLLGPDIHLHFGDSSEDPDIVYIHNESSGMDYEVIRIHGSYQTIVMGMSEEEVASTNSPVKQRRRRKNKAHEDDSEDEE